MVEFPNRLLSGICQPSSFSKKIVSQLCSRQKLRLLGSTPAFDSLHRFSSKDTEGTDPGLTRHQHAPALLQWTPGGFKHSTEKLLSNFPWQKWRERQKKPPTPEQSLGGTWYSSVTNTQETCIKQGLNSISEKKHLGREHTVIHYTCLWRGATRGCNAWQQRCCCWLWSIITLHVMSQTCPQAGKRNSLPTAFLLKSSTSSGFTVLYIIKQPLGKKME